MSKYSAITVINDIVQNKKRAGERVYNLSVGEAILPTPAVLIEAATDFVRAGDIRYAPIAGLPELRSAAAQWMNQTYNTNYSVEQTLVTCGGKFGLYLLCRTLLQSGDEALVIAPYWTSYPDILELVGARPKFVAASPKAGFKVQPNDIAQACGPKTKLLILNNASNPTGVVYTRAELAAILDAAKEKNITVISDEIYSGLVYDEEYISCGSFPEHQDRVIVVQSCSKNFAMTGWRVGFVFAPAKIIKDLAGMQSSTITGTSTVSQVVAMAALANAEVIMSDVKKQMQARRDVFMAEFNRLFKQSLIPPASALYAFIPLTAFGISGQDAGDFCKQALAKCNVAMVPGDDFGQAGYVRCSFGAPEEEIREALQNLTQF